MATIQTLYHTQPDHIHTIVKDLRAAFLSGVTKTYAWRLKQLQGIRKLLIDHKTAIEEALQQDLGRSAFESTVAEYGAVKLEVEFVIKHLKKWMRPKKVRSSFLTQPASSQIIYEPLGVVLVLGPWNYPINLVLMPLIAAIAAGNCVVVKPSELTPHSAAFLSKNLLNYVDKQCVQVVTGGVETAQTILEHPFDHIFYTGGGKAAQAVMTAAAKHLTPITLELGGKSPCVVDEDVDLKTSVRRLVWAKFFNGGQTCIAPDYVLVHKGIEKEFLKTLTQTIREFYGDTSEENSDLARIVNAKHYQRLLHLLAGNTILLGGKSDEKTLFIEPTVVVPSALNAPIMQEEIFGPILPVVTVDNIDQAIQTINSKPKPLALYVFSTNRETQENIVNKTSSGGACINDAMYHMASPYLPFGGVGPSGMGSYHGQYGFEALSHKKSVMKKPTFFDPSFRYPPYNAKKLRWLKWLFK